MQTDGRTDGRTDEQTFVIVESLSRLKIYHWILEWGDLVVCTSSNLDITLFLFKELDKTKYGQISVILLTEFNQKMIIVPIS